MFPQQADLPVEQIAGRQGRMLQSQLSPLTGLLQLLRHMGRQIGADAPVQLLMDALVLRPVVKGVVTGVLLGLQRQRRHVVQPLPDRAAPVVDDGQPGGTALPNILLHGLPEQHPLGVKIAVAQPLHHPHPPGDVRHGGVLIPLFRKQLHGRVQDLLPPYLRRL